MVSVCLDVRYFISESVVLKVKISVMLSSMMVFIVMFLSVEML